MLGQSINSKTEVARYFERIQKPKQAGLMNLLRSIAIEMVPTIFALSPTMNTDGIVSTISMKTL